MPPADPNPVSPTELNRRRDLILAHEEAFANLLALAVIERPRLSVWMILIPIIFVFYFQRFNAGRKSFADHYLVSRRRAVEAGTSPDLDGVVALARLPESQWEAYRRFVETLADLYGDLLRARGTTYDDLVRAAFRGRGEYLLSMNRLAQAEIACNRALKPDMTESDEVLEPILEKMETRSRELRAAGAERSFGK